MSSAPASSSRILNVDDHAPARFLRTRILERAGYSVDEADTAGEAIARGAAAALVLLDVKLPDGDGFGVCEHLKMSRPDLPIVMVTSVYRTEQARRDAFSVGADAYLLDPVEPARLVSTVGRLVNGGAGTRPRQDDAEAWAITDAVGHIHDLSPAAAALLNLSRRGAIGRSLTNFFVDNRPKLMGELMRAAEGVLIARATTLHPRDRRPRRVHIEVAILPDDPGARVRLRWTLEMTPEVLSDESPEPDTA